MDLWIDKLSEGRHLAHDHDDIGARHGVGNDQIERSPLDDRPNHRGRGQGTERSKYRPPIPGLFGLLGEPPEFLQWAHRRGFYAAAKISYQLLPIAKGAWLDASVPRARIPRGPSEFGVTVHLRHVVASCPPIAARMTQPESVLQRRCTASPGLLIKPVRQKTRAINSYIRPKGILSTTEKLARWPPVDA